MPEKTKKTILPFMSSADAENGVPTDEVEKAAVFCLAELNRAKGGGFFKKKSSEKTVFMAEVYYPFWIAPFNGLTLLFDGLNSSSYTVTYPIIPDTKGFTANMNERAITRQSYSTFLSNNIGYFQCSTTEQTKVIDGLTTDLEFLKEFTDYVEEAITIEKPVIGGVIVSPADDEKQILNNVVELENLRAEVAHELETLIGIIKILNTKTQSFLSGLREEVKNREKKFSAQIKVAEAVFADKKSQINKEYVDQVTSVSSKFEQEKVFLRSEVIKLERDRDNLTSELEKVENEIKNAAISKDDEIGQRWKEKRNELRKKLPGLAPAIKDFQEKIQIIDENKKNELFHLRQANETKIKEAGRDLMEIESALDAEVKTCQEEMVPIEELTSKIIDDLDKLTKIMDASLENFDGLGIKLETSPLLLVYMPFYLVCYVSKTNKRFDYFSPSIVRNGEMNGRLKTIGRKRITKLFQPRSQKIVSILNKFVGLLEENVAFSHEITDACKKADLLHSKEAVESIKNGLNELKTSGHLSEDEFDTFNQILK